MNKAYPAKDYSQEAREEHAVNHFLTGYRNAKAAYDVMSQNPKTLAEAVEKIKMVEHNFMATVGSRRNNISVNKIRQLGWVDEELGEDLETDIDDATMRRVTANTSPTNLLQEILDEMKETKVKLCQLATKKSDHQITPPPSPSRGRQFQRTGARRSSRSPSPSRLKCLNCNSSNHLLRDCPKPGADECFVCHAKDHFYKDCPQRKGSVSPVGSKSPN